MPVEREHVRTVASEGELNEQRVAAIARMKIFCASILKKLAPPLLREVEAAPVLRPGAEPFTPSRSGRLAPSNSHGGKQVKKANIAESTLLKALGIVPQDLVVTDESLQEFRALFDSPVREQQLRVLASIFGKTVPPRCQLMEQAQDVCLTA